MSARLKAGESPRKGLRRIALEQIAKALDDLSDAAEPAETVHSARKRLKRLRALLRLALDGMDPAIYDREKARLRDAAHPLAEARDTAVLVDTLDDLIERSGDLGQLEALGRTRDALLGRKSDAIRRALGEGAALERLAATLHEVREALGSDAFRGVTWPVLRTGLRRIYRRGRRAGRDAAGAATVEQLHAWRKRVKDLGYALEVVEPIRPSVVRQRVNLADELAESLGDDHDLAMLRQTLLAGAGPSPAVVALLPLIDARRAQLQEAAFALGRKVYRERPRDFAGRLDASWHEWRGGAGSLIGIRFRLEDDEFRGGNARSIDPALGRPIGKGGRADKIERSENVGKTRRGGEMDVHLTGKAERFVRSQIDRGRFRTEDEVLTAALRLLEEREQWTDVPSIPPDEAEFERRLVAEGLLSRVPLPPGPARSRSFEPIRIEGEPLSETVIRERR